MASYADALCARSVGGWGGVRVRVRLEGGKRMRDRFVGGGGGGGDDCVASPKSVCRGGYEALVSQRKRMFFPAFVSFAAAAGDTEAGNGVCSPTIGFGEKKSRVYSRLQLCGIITDKKYIARRICCRPASNVAHSFR